MLILLAGFFSLLFASTEIVADKTLQNVLNAPSLNAEATNGRMCVKFAVNDQGVWTSEENKEKIYEFYGKSTDEMITKAILKENGKFKVGNLYFKVLSSEGRQIKIYAVYDRTFDRENLINTSLIMVILFASSMLLIALVAYIVSSRLVNPVEQSFIKQRDLIANASHELKTPLTIISTNLSVVESEPESRVKDNSKWISSINTQVSRMNGLIMDMLELSKLEQSVMPKENVDLSKITEGACLTFEAVCFEKGISLVTDVAEGVTVYGDKNALERLIVILLDNAKKYCGEQGKIGCQLRADGKRARLTVMNTGESISKEDAKRVFERFYRSDGARQNPDNSSFGLGLSIAQATVRAHDGGITCHGVENKGTVFEVSLPLPKKNAPQKEKA